MQDERHAGCGIGLRLDRTDPTILPNLARAFGLGQLTGTEFTYTHAGHYAQIIRRCYRRRVLIAVSNSILRDAYAPHEEATLVLWGPDYDGTHKAWVRFADGDQIVGGSRVTRGG